MPSCARRSTISPDNTAWPSPRSYPARPSAFGIAPASPSADASARRRSGCSSSAHTASCIFRTAVCSIRSSTASRVSCAVRSSRHASPVTSDQAHLGLARYLQVVVERGSQTAQVVLVANAEASAPLAGCLELIRRELDGALHSLCVQCSLRSIEQRTRDAFRALLWTCDGGGALRWSAGALPAWRFRAEQSRGRATHHRPPARADSSRIVRDRILCRGGCHRAVGDRSST